MSEAGSVLWPSVREPLWRFNWRLADSPDQEGVVIRNASYRDHQVFYKASLPSLRVQYDGRCGPYKDPLNYDNAHTTTACPAQRVCLYTYTSGGQRALTVQSYHTIGAYRLTHRWVFWEDGAVMARLYSAGLQCPYNHRHHAYWRFDFDLDGAGSDVVLEYNTSTPDQGYGPGWHGKRHEIARVKSPSSRRSWAVMDQRTGRGYHILPGVHDGQADPFSYRDLWVLRYHGAEDRHGQQGDASADGLQAYLNGEDVDGKDVVVWYCGHLSHEAHGGGDEWHHVGPDLIPFRWS
jgi:Cu2+-containing amine oxidase